MTNYHKWSGSNAKHLFATVLVPFLVIADFLAWQKEGEPEGALGPFYKGTNLIITS